MVPDPDPDAKFRLRVDAPYGKEVLKAVVTAVWVDPRRFGAESAPRADLIPVKPGQVKGVFVELKEQHIDRADHQALERREGDLSVMTYFLVELLKKGNHAITLSDAFEHLEANVPVYVHRKPVGNTQTPVLVDYSASDIYLRP